MNVTWPLRIVIFALACTVLGVAPAHAWWWDQHRQMTRWSLELLPGKERLVFDDDLLIEASVAPDVDRDKGSKKDWEYTAHWLDIPVAEVEEYTKKAHTETWIVDKWIGKMEEFFRKGERRKALFCAGIAAHCIQDVSSPFHVSDYIRASGIKDPWIEIPVEQMVVSGDLTLDLQRLSLVADISEPISQYTETYVKQFAIDESKGIVSLGETEEELSKLRKQLAQYCRPGMERSGAASPCWAL